MPVGFRKQNVQFFHPLYAVHPHDVSTLVGMYVPVPNGHLVEKKKDSSAVRRTASCAFFLLTVGRLL